MSSPSEGIEITTDRSTVFIPAPRYATSYDPNSHCPWSLHRGHHRQRGFYDLVMRCGASTELFCVARRMRRSRVSLNMMMIVNFFGKLMTTLTTCRLPRHRKRFSLGSCGSLVGMMLLSDSDARRRSTSQLKPYVQAALPPRPSRAMQAAVPRFGSVALSAGSPSKQWHSLYSPID